MSIDSENSTNSNGENPPAKTILILLLLFIGISVLAVFASIRMGRVQNIEASTKPAKAVETEQALAAEKAEEALDEVTQVQPKVELKTPKAEDATLLTTQETVEVEETENAVIDENNSMPKEDVTVSEEVQTPELVQEVDTISPSFDVVRVDEDGGAIIAGRAEPDSTVSLMADGKEVSTVKADKSGSFALILDLPNAEEAQELQLETKTDDVIVESKETVLVLPRPKSEEAPAKIVIAEETGDVRVENPLDVAPDIIQDLSLDTINYSETGDVVVTGRASSDQAVRVYLDNEPVSLGTAEQGRWQLEIPEIKEGVYTLRIDALDDAGKVVKRVESPFKRVSKNELGGNVTIQPGFTLWQLARETYGSGTQFVQIYEANKDLIKDPNLIYPGQVFQVPNE